MRKIRTLLALCLIFLGVTTAMADGTFKDFTIDLTKETPELPEGVTQVSYAQNGAKYNGAQHGWMWYAIKFAVDGPVKVTLGGCQYAKKSQAEVYDEKGTKIADIDTKTPGCQHNGGYAEWDYTGEAQTLTLYCGEYCPSIKVAKASNAPSTTTGDFEISLLAENPELPAGVTQISYPTHGASWHKDSHGWCWYAIEFEVDGATDITIGGCDYQNNNFGYVEDANGNKIADITNDKCANTYTYQYKGEAQKLKLYCGQYCPSIKVKKVDQTKKEKVLYKTKFQDWEAIKSSTEETVVTKKTALDSEIKFSFMETSLDPVGHNDKFSAEVITDGYIMAAKTATPYLKTSTIDNVSTVKFIHCATGGSRGWGLKVKGDGDADWVTVSNAFADQKGTAVTVDVNRTNVQLWFYNLEPTQNAYMTELEIKSLVEVEPRDFTDFTIDFRDGDTKKYTVVSPKAGLPKGVTVDGGEFHDAQHGFSNVQMTVAVDGPVKFSIGSCGYTDKATVSIDGGTPINIDTKAGGCDNRFGEYAHSTTYIYNVEKPATLKFNLGLYCPFIKAEACDFIPNVTVSYFNTDGKLIGEEVVAGNSELKYKYSASDVKIAEGQAFRGWFESKSNTAKKVKEGIALVEDIRLYAKATPIEVAKLGAIYSYQLNSTSFYPEDHELFKTTGEFHDGQHGFIFAADQSLSVDVAGNALLVFGTCKYGKAGTMTVTDANGKVVGEPINVPVDTDKDGVTASISYNGPATTLTATFSNETYIHNLTVYNVSEIPTKGESGYYEIAANDGASLLLVLASLKDGDKVFLPNGTYDLGETVLTTISANNVSIIGESMDKTIIRNAPDKSTEGIGTTATLLNTSKNLYMQDLTLQNALDYYALNGTGRAVCLQDKGENTICKNVKMLSYQDTYYSNNASMFYWEDCEVHGTVDYLCGDGDIIYNRCKFVNESRKPELNQGSTVLCAPYTSDNMKWGYVFLDCSIQTLSKDFTFARAWGGKPRAQFLRTTLLEEITKSRLAEDRFTIAGMNIVADNFKEYKTTDVNGKLMTPSSNVIEFTHSSGNKKYETVLSDAEAEKYTIANIFGDWKADEIAAQITDPEAGDMFLVNGKITSVRPTSGKYRIANARGGFGPVIDIEALRQIDGKDVTDQYIKNADFAQQFEGWTVENFSKDDKTGKDMFAKQNLSGWATQAYAGWTSLTTTEYSLTQKIKLPAGKYKLVAQALYRQMMAYNSDEKTSHATLKAGDKSVAIKTLGSETLKSYANDLSEAAGVFSSGMYTNEIEFEVTGSGSTLIGIEGTFDEKQSWLAVGSFKLYDMNQKADIIDMTKRIANNSFENGLESWKVEGAWEGKKSSTAEDKTITVGTSFAEKWQNESAGALAAGKLSQTITGLENGKYIIKAAAFANGEGTQIFANDKTVAAPTEAAIVSIEIEVTDGKITLGFERTAANKASWTAVDNFQLFFVQNEPATAIETVTIETIQNARPKKFIKNGKICIIKNGKIYNVMGVAQE